MKQLFLLLVSLALMSCSLSSDEKTITTDLVNSPLTANSNAEKVLTPNIEMLETSYDFGEMQQGESVTHDFILKNTGDADLIITAAKGSCGCTVSQWPKNPIAKGEEAAIKVTFNSAGKSGKQNKTVTLVSNAIPNTKVITINGNVIVPQKK
ncbi:MAG: DUF1573 domain-containing protein [Flavobacteriales bacterium]|jgi:hypothetical protein|nr:DUF1573 domain-containing protein [Flavobacteriales bacterium]MBT5090529.1 DUF1573 domain-containing protein [Flavobacteriales bacterium]MBT5750389.1 DUF1573 domain-containing protein [Flavobacteriales bacterium]